MANNIVMLGQRKTDLNLPSVRGKEHLVDLFCGCGGSGGGLLDAAEILARRVRGTFVNHWDKAIKIHSANHPEHRHLEEDLFKLDPTQVFPPGTFCSLLWASPQCTFFSIARGSSCVNEQDRSHANSVMDWVRHLRPEAVMVENVKEFAKWGPVIQKRHDKGPFKGELVWTKGKGGRPLKALPIEHVRGPKEAEEEWWTRMVSEGYSPYEVPDKSREGEYFDAWKDEMRTEGYDVDHRVLASCDYGDPTIRARLYVYCVRLDSGKKIVWPEPYAQSPKKQTKDPRPMRWMTARDCVDWDLKGDSVFTREKDLADNTFRRLAIGLVKFGLREFLVSSAHGSPQASDCQRRVHDPDEPLQALTAKGERGVVQAKAEFLVPNFGERPGQTPRTHDIDEPLPAVTSHGAGGLVEAEAFLVPQHTGAKKDWVKSLDTPASTITTTMAGEGLAEPHIVQMKGQSHAQSVDAPLTALTQSQSHYLSCPLIDHIRGTGVAAEVDEPLRAITAGGSHQAIAEAFMFAIDQTGGENKNDGTYPVDEPVRTLVTKANQTCIEVDVRRVEARFLKACDDGGVDTRRARTFLKFLVEELKNRGKVDAKPWIYVYYSNGAEGKDIDEPLPTVRTKAGHALVYPVIELHGQMLRIDLLYRMLTPVELQRAMGFPDDMDWAGCTKTETIRAIGNSVSRGVARALGLAWYSQDTDVWSKVRHIYANYEWEVE